ncbi:MAG: hypothetical protein R3D26_07620 [Cyanobacteriota/Melainabacteria group bacterium]
MTDPTTGDPVTDPTTGDPVTTTTTTVTEQHWIYRFEIGYI